MSDGLESFLKSKKKANQKNKKPAKGVPAAKKEEDDAKTKIVDEQFDEDAEETKIKFSGGVKIKSAAEVQAEKKQ